MCMAPVNEELDRAYSNVGLFASDVWSYQEVDECYKKANLNLWIKFNEIEKLLVGNYCDDSQSSVTNEVRTVRDVLPLSRLASYGDYPYNEEREKMYNNVYEPAEYVEYSSNADKGDMEVWMLPEVDNLFKLLTNVSTSRWTATSPRNQTVLAPVHNVMATCPLQWLSQTTWPAQILSRYPDLPCTLQDSRSVSFFLEDTQVAYSLIELEEKLLEFPCPRYLIETSTDLELHIGIDTPAIRNLWVLCYDIPSPGVVLNADVSEFQPVTVRQLPLPYPPVFDESYRTEVFPYSFGYVQTDPRPIAVCTKDQQSISDIPKPSQLHFNVEAIGQGRRKPLVSDRVHLNQTIDGSSTKKNPTTEQILATLEKWVNKIYKRRSTDFSTLSSMSSHIDQSFQNVHQHYILMQELSPQNIFSTQRPLYSDVLMNGGVTASDYKFDQLEQEALDQYSGSDTTLHDKLYQDLEREAVAQYQQSQSNLESQPNFWNSSPPVEEAKQNVSPDNHSPCRSFCSVISTSPSLMSSKRSNADGNFEICNPKKQALWMKKKKKKQEKKKKNTKIKKKSPPEQHNNKHFENEILTINKFCHLKSHFEMYTETEWKLFESFVTGEVSNLFKECLQMVDECSKWFMDIITCAELKQDYRSNKMRLELSGNIVDTLHDLLNTLNQYVACYSKIKIIITFDHRLNKAPHLIRPQQSLLLCGLDLYERNVRNVDESVTRVELFSELAFCKHIKKLLNCIVPHQSIMFASNLTWMLTLSAYDVQSPAKQFYVQMGSKQHTFCLALVRRETPILDYHNNHIKMIDEIPIWHSYQWRFPDGWDYGSNCVYICNSLHWASLLRVSALKNIIDISRILLMVNWLSDFMNDKPECSLTYELLWNIRKADLVRSKIRSTRLVMMWGDRWTLREVTSNLLDCDPWTLGGEKSCCGGWVQTKPSASKTSKANFKARMKQVKVKNKLPERMLPKAQLMISSQETDLISEKPNQSSCSLQ